MSDAMLELTASELHAVRNRLQRILDAVAAVATATREPLGAVDSPKARPYVLAKQTVVTLSLYIILITSTTIRSIYCIVPSDLNSNRATVIDHQPPTSVLNHQHPLSPIGNHNWWQSKNQNSRHFIPTFHKINKNDIKQRVSHRSDYNGRQQHGTKDSFAPRHVPRIVGNSMIRALPNGPPPFRPSNLALDLSSLGILEKLKRTKMFKRVYKSKVYYLFLDVLQQLALLADKIAKKKIDITGSNVAAIQAVAGKILLKGGQQLKLKWPFVMLNPHFIKEMLANPTFLVMLFHAIETAYMSTPMTFWLKPLVKLVKQSSPEKEDEVWWRRKRIYEVLNGPGSSELEPSLKAVHFKNPGELAPISFSNFVDTFRQMTGRPGPKPAYHHQPANHEGHSSSQVFPFGEEIFYADSTPAEHGLLQHGHQEQATTYQDDEKHNSDAYMTSEQEEAFLANQLVSGQAYLKPKGRPISYHDDIKNDPVAVRQSNNAVHGLEAYHQVESAPIDNFNFDSMNLFESKPKPPQNHGHPWPLDIGANQIMSQREFDSLDPREKQLVLQETRNSQMEGRLAEEMIRQQSEFVNSFSRRHDGTLIIPPFALAS